MKSLLIPFQPDLRVILPVVIGNVDYALLSNQLHRMDELLLLSNLEANLVESALKHWAAQSQQPLKPITAAELRKMQAHFHLALRCNIARILTGESFRDFSARLADSPLLQWFCQIDRLDTIRVPGKSSLERYSKCFSEPELRAAIQGLTRQAGQAPAQLNLKVAVDLEQYFMDTTGLKTSIHFPVDWVLLRDATRTLMKAVILIRGHGLKARMEAPETFMKAMNKLCIAMTHQRGQPGSKKERKRVLRLMKRQAKLIRAHARRHHQLLADYWAETEWSQAQAQQVLQRMDNVLEQLPAAIKQAHERIIGERVVATEEKILSLYEKETQVLVRGKAGARVEFGNTLLLVENLQGLIVDWNLFEEAAPSDTRLVQPSLERIKTELGVAKGLATDRGFASKANEKYLEEEGIYNGMCPKGAGALRERMKEEPFRAMQTRRSQTEGRIGIFKNVYYGEPGVAKGYEHRKQAVVWAVLTHNLVVMAGLEEVEELAAQAA